MARHTTPAQPFDERLGELLAVERRLQAQVEAARAQAARRVKAARADGERARQAAQARAAEQARRDEAEDRAAHAETLARLEAEHRARLAWLRALPDDVFESLVRRAVARAVDGGER